MASAPETLLQRYLRWRRPIEVAVVGALLAVNTIFNIEVATLDLERWGHPFAPREPAIWEWTSTAMWCVLIPAIVAFEHRVPLQFGTFRRNAPWHVLASVAVSLAHVVGMFGLRAAIYASQGAHYPFWDWPREFFYEYLKDARTYVLVLVVMAAYRLLLLRLQGEARLLEAPDAGPPVEPVERPERFLVRKLGREFLLPAGEIESLQAQGNYVNLRVRGRDYPLRSTMAAIEERLDATRFVRVHRSYMVNLDCVAEIEPTDGGDARLRMKDGSVVPCSRRYRDNLRSRAVA
jgi:DNA-binding LytR/AlgR family response regulator